MKVYNEVTVLGGGEHAGSSFCHLMICNWEELGNRSSQHLHVHSAGVGVGDRP